MEQVGEDSDEFLNPGPRASGHEHVHVPLEHGHFAECLEAVTARRERRRAHRICRLRNLEDCYFTLSFRVHLLIYLRLPLIKW